MTFSSYGDVDESVDDALYPGNALSPLDEDSSLDSERNATESRTETEEDAGLSARPGTGNQIFVRILLVGTTFCYCSHICNSI